MWTREQKNVYQRKWRAEHPDAMRKQYEKARKKREEVRARKDEELHTSKGRRTKAVLSGVPGCIPEPTEAGRKLAVIVAETAGVEGNRAVIERLPLCRTTTYRVCLALESNKILEQVYFHSLDDALHHCHRHRLRMKRYPDISDRAVDDFRSSRSTKPYHTQNG